MNRKPWAETLGPIKRRFAGVVVVTVFAVVVVMTAAFYHGNHDSRAAKSEFMTSHIKLGGMSFYYPGQSEVKYYTIKLTNASVSTLTSDISKFLRDPVGRLRQQGIAVPPASELHWKALTAALRRLSNPQIPSRSTEGAPKDNPNLKNEIVRLQIPGGWISVAGDLGGGGNSFLADPVRYLHTQGVNVRSEDEPAWRQLAAALKALRLEYANSRVNVNRKTSADSEIAQNGNRAGRLTSVAIDPGDTKAPANKRAGMAKPDLIIRQFLFPPTNDKALRVHIVNSGRVGSGACRLVLTIRKINGVSVGRQTHVNVPALAAGADTWLLIDAKSILPNNVSLASTTFKLNADASSIVAESDEANNEVWHNQ
ncbi:MAG: CARDB domain-containing protein [Pyrinomonadaceae bacterium]